MQKQTKVINTKTLEIGKTNSVLVTEGKLLFLDVENKKIRALYKPIIVSETEKVEVGDWKYCYNTDTILQCHDKEKNHLCEDCKKILALPEHFSPKDLQDIVDGKLNGGDIVLVECESFVGWYKDNNIVKSWADIPNNEKWECGEINAIKLNESNQITLHKPEKKKHTTEEVEALLLKICRECGNMLITEKDISDWLKSNTN